MPVLGAFVWPSTAVSIHYGNVQWSRDQRHPSEDQSATSSLSLLLGHSYSSGISTGFLYYSILSSRHGLFIKNKLTCLVSTDPGQVRIGGCCTYFHLQWAFLTLMANEISAYAQNPPPLSPEQWWKPPPGEKSTTYCMVCDKHIEL